MRRAFDLAGFCAVLLTLVGERDLLDASPAAILVMRVCIGLHALGINMQKCSVHTCPSCKCKKNYDG